MKPRELTDDQLDRYYRHQDSGQHGEQEEPQTPPWWLGAGLAGAAVLVLGFGFYWLVRLVEAAWRWS